MEANENWYIRGKSGCGELIKQELIKRGGIIDIDNYEYSDNDCLYFIVDKMVLCKFSQSNGGKYMIEHWEEIKAEEAKAEEAMKNYPDLKQCKELAKILPIESADMYWKNGVSDKYIQCFAPFVRCGTDMDYDYDVPCWSLAALLNVIPIWYDIHPTKSGVTIKCDYGKEVVVISDNLVNACVGMILKLNELDLL